MKAQSTTKKAQNGEKSLSGKRNVSKTKPTRAKRVQPLAPKQFLHIIENMSDGVVVLDKDWYYVYVNQKAAAMLQRKNPSDLIGKHIWTEYPEGVGQPFQLAYEKAMREQTPIVFEEHYEPWDLWFENRIYPSPDSLLILFTEVTDKKRTEALLKERQYLLQKILDTEPGTVYIYDLDERRNIYVNRQWLAEYGYTPEETQAMGDELLARIFHPDELEQISAHHKNWREAGEGNTREIEYRILAKTGEWHWVHSHEAPFIFDELGRVKQILGISYEVTPRREAQEALRRSEQELALIYDTISDITFLLSIEPEDRYRFISVNKAFLQATGLKSEQILGRYADEIIPPASQALVFGNYRKAIQGKTSVTWDEVSEYPAGEKTAIVTVTPVFNETGDCTHLVGAIHDITQRKKAEAEVREQNRLISALAETTPGLVYVYDWGTDSNVYSNRGIEFLLGYTSEEVKKMGTNLFPQLLHPDDGAAVVASQQRLASASDKDVLEIDYRMRHSNGEWRWLRSYERPFARNKDGSLKQKIGIAIDITERKQTEDALAASEAELRALFASMNDLVLVIDRDGVYRKIAPTNPSLLYRPPEKLLGKTLLDVFPVERAQAFIRSVRQVVETQRTTHIEYELMINGQEVWFDASISAMEADKTLWMVRNITDRKQAEKALRESEEKFSKVFHASPIPLSITRLSDGHYIEVNDSFLKRLGYQREEILGRSAQEVGMWVSSRDREKMMRMLQEKMSVRNFETEFRTKSGEIGTTLLFRDLIELAGEEYIIGTSLDITERKQMENELRKLNLELEERISARTEELAAAMIRAQEADRLKSAFLAAMSHELRTPLNSIIGFTGVILQGLAGPLNEEQTKQLNMMRDSARHLLALINDVLDISKIEAGQLVIMKRPFDMRQAIESALRVVLPLAQKKALSLETSIGPGVGILNTDRRRVEQVLINLINNAIKFTEHGQVQIACQIRDGWLETSVQDSGIGIKPEDMEKLFKPFHQIDTGLARGHEGTGLGLAICKRLVTAMGGDITVESQWGIGSTFTFTLPV